MEILNMTEGVSPCRQGADWQWKSYILLSPQSVLHNDLLSIIVGFFLATRWQVCCGNPLYDHLDRVSYTIAAIYDDSSFHCHQRAGWSWKSSMWPYPYRVCWTIAAIYCSRFFSIATRWQVCSEMFDIFPQSRLQTLPMTIVHSIAVRWQFGSENPIYNHIQSYYIHQYIFPLSSDGRLAVENPLYDYLKTASCTMSCYLWQ